MDHSRREYARSAFAQLPSSISQAAAFSFASGKSKRAKASAVGEAHAFLQAKRSSSDSRSPERHGLAERSTRSPSGIGIDPSSSSRFSIATLAPRFTWTGIAPVLATICPSPETSAHANVSEGNVSTPSFSGRIRYTSRLALL